ncbi:MAG: folate-binding protein [Novosphingobium sp.]|nr:folate-binding protein [Novosphingobium sp.]
MTATRLCNRTLVRLSALDPEENVADFLQGLVTQDVTGKLPVWTGLLTPQGKVLFDFLVWPADTGLLLDCEADAADALVRRLSLYRLRRKIGIARDDGLAVHWRPHTGDGAATDPRLSALGERWVAPREDSGDECADDCADGAWLAHRLRHGVTEGRAELGDGELLWLECNAAELHGVSFTKGCYVGQENTARMNWRQKVNRRLVVAPMDRSDPARRRIAYPELGLAVDHRRAEDIRSDLRPHWLTESDEARQPGTP